MAQYKYKVIRSNTDSAALEANLNLGAEGGWKIIKIDYIIDDFNGKYFNLIFEKKE